MRPSALPILRCPLCRGELSLHASRVEEEEVIEGSLHCRACGRGYPIKEGVPDFVVEPCLRATNRLQKALYDRLEARLAELSGFSEEELRREVVSRMEIGERDSVLEICVGTGGNIPYFREYTKGPIAGLDISEGMLSTCRKRALEEDWGEVELFLGCAEYLPFADEVFDRVLIGGGISYFSDPKRALAEAARVAKRKAKVVVYEPVSYTHLTLPTTERV